MTAVIAAIAVLAVASVSALAAATKPGTSKATAQVARRAYTQPARRTDAEPRAAATTSAGTGSPTTRPRRRRRRSSRPRPPDPAPAAASRAPAAGARHPAGAASAPGHLRRLVSTSYATATLEAIGTTAIVVVQEPAVREAERLLAAELDAIDRTCSRFRPDSELMRANDAAGRLTPTSGLFTEAVRIALRAAEQTEGAVDPTVAPALVALGYDRDFAAMDADAADDVRGIPAAGWRSVALDAAAAAAADGPRVPPRSRGDGQGACRRPRRAAHRRGDGLAHARRPRWRRGDGRPRPRGRVGRST